MKRILAVALLAAAGIAAVAATCVVTNEALTEIDGRDSFAGEMQNDSGVDILQHQYTIAFLNDDGGVVESRVVDGCMRSLQDGESNFFALRSNQPKESTEIGLARMANLLEDPDFTVGEVEEGDITIATVTAARTGTSLVVAGTITNNDEDDLEEPIVCAVVWKQSGRVLTVARDTGIDDLAEGESADFEMTITVPDEGAAVEEVDIYVDGLEDEVPVEPESSDDILVGQTPTNTPAPTNTAAPTNTPEPTATNTPEGP